MVKFLLPLFAMALLLMGCSPDTTTTDTDTYGYGDSSSSTATMSSASNSSSSSSSSAKPAAFDGTLLKGKHTVVLKTSKGDITLELDADAAPHAVTNFVTLTKQGYYDGLIFHRVIADFMIQGGDPKGNGTGGESIFGKTFDDENLNAPMVRGTLAMANRGPDTNGSQFFIIQAASTPWLQGSYTAFGKVTEGMDVVDAIANAKRDASDKPLEDITFTPEVEGE